MPTDATSVNAKLDRMADFAAPRGRRVVARNSGEALALTLREIIDCGARIDAAQPYCEILDFTVETTDPRDRVLINPSASFDLTVSVARLVWMISGDDRLADIRFYEQAVTRFSDNQLSVPGSNYGTRMFQPRPGVNQIESNIARLGKDLTTRRASTVIWQAEDAMRDSLDIPCAFGLHFNVRDGVLYTQLKMRSNNAFLLLGVNLFEFGLVAEIISAEVGVELGPLANNAGSMHLYERERGRWELALQDYDPNAERVAMVPMPVRGALKQAYELARKEALLRHELHLIAREDRDALDARSAGLDPWWSELFRILLSHALLKVGRYRTAVGVVADLHPALAARATQHLEKVRHRAVEEGADQLFVMEETHGVASLPTGSAVRETWDPAEREQALSHLRAVVHRIAQETEIPVLLSEYDELATEMIDRRPALAARSEDSDPGARFGLHFAEVHDRLRVIRERGRKP